MILSDADNHPPMLDKDLYDSWKSRMDLYMQNREHGRMILESVENGPLIWPTVEENGVIRTKKYAKLSAAEKIQADCDMKATNIILQGLPADIYSLVNHHRVAKDLWERVQLLMQGISLTKQERECKLYDAFDKFTHIKGESLHTLPPEWSKFVTDVKLVKDLHTSNFDQLHSYLEQHELHANEVCIMRESNQDPLAFVANQQMTPPHFNTYQSYYNNPQLQQKDTSFAAHVFSPGDDPIACLNKAMAFLTAVASSRETNSYAAGTSRNKELIIQEKEGIHSAKAVLMANLSSYESDVLSEMFKCAATIAPGMYKVKLVILAPKVKNNREAHEYYLMHTMEQAAILRELIQELLGYIRDTCPDISQPSEKLVVVTPINKKKTVRFADTVTSSGNIPKVSNLTSIVSIGVIPFYLVASGSKPSGNTKNDRISQTPSSNEKYKVEHPVKGAQALCSVCNECLFDANHAICLIDIDA
ncbi:hypothetical protein Tco_1539854 [Tanacetum coccineum]